MKWSPKTDIMRLTSRPTVKDTVEAVRKRFGKESMMKLSEKLDIEVDIIPTGSVGLDHALGVGGLPRGRIAEIYGPEASGKTTLALHIIAEAQKKGEACAIIDAEHALDPAYAKKIGVDVGELFISQPDGGEQALQIVQQIVHDGSFGVVVIDSVAALTPRNEIEGQIGDQNMAPQARLMAQAMRILTGDIHRNNILVIFINQIRSNIGGYGNPEITPGGRALKFSASVRIDIRRKATIKHGEQAIGAEVTAKVVKNKVSAPFRSATFQIIFDEGISRTGEILTLGESLKIVNRTGAFYEYGKHKLGRGYDSARAFLKENPEIADAIVQDIRTSHKDL